jgi:large subunit ribosomal protein L29
MAKQAKNEKVFNYAQADEVELGTRLKKTEQDLFKLRFRAASAPIKNTMQIRKLRREVARLNTFINQRTKSKTGSVAKKSRGNGRAKS